MIRPLSLCLLLASVAVAQGPADVSSMYIVAPQGWVLAAGTVPLGVQAYNSFGSSIPDFTPAWASRTPDIASVDAAGVVTGLAPGVAVIEAATPAGLTSTLSIGVYPARIDITPSPVEMFAGESRKLTAQAIDAAGNAIPNLSFVWQVDLSGVASVNDSGTVTALQQGRVTLLARLVSSDPSFVAQGETLLNIRRRPDYTLTRVALPGHGSTTIRDVSGLSVSKNDKYSYIADLGTGAQAAVLVENGVSTVLATTGTYIPEAGAVAAQFLGTSVNSSGDVALQMSHVAEWCQRSIVVFTKKGQRLLDQNNNCMYQIMPRALNDAGDFALLRQDNSGARYVSVVRADGTLRDVATFGAAFTGLGHLNSVDRLSAGEGGSVHFVGSGDNGSKGAFWWDGKTMRKLLVTGDSYPGSIYAITDINDVKESATGVYYIVAHLPNGSVALRSDNGSLSEFAVNGRQIGASTINWIHAYLDARPSGVTFPVGTGEGDAYVLGSSSLSVVGLRTLDKWTDITPVFITSKGALLTIQPGTGSGRQLVQFDASGSTVLVAAGQKWNGDAPPGSGFAIISRNPLADSAVVRAPGGVLYNVRAGAVTTALSLGDSISSGLGAVTALASHRASSSGAIAFTGNRKGAFGLYLSRGGTVTKLSEIYSASDLATDGRQLAGFVSWPNYNLLAVNASDQIATYCAGANGAGSSVCIADPATKTVRFIYNTRNSMSDGTVMTDIWQLTMDDAGRVLFYGPTAKGPALAYWDGKTSRKILAPGDVPLPGATFANISTLHAAGGAFYLSAGFTGAMNRGILKFDGTKLTKILGDDVPVLSIPQSLNNFYGPEFAANARGDIAFFAVSGIERFLAVHKADGTDTLVASSLDRTPDDAWPTSYTSMSLSDTGVVHLAGEAWVSGQRQMVLYRAVPK